MNKRTVKNKDFVFICKKCGHLLFTSTEKLKKILKTECPSCGEEPDDNWILSRMSNYEVEYGRS